jgi:hypothetical protein
MDWSKFGEWGILGLIIGAFFFMAWRRDIWIMKFVNDIIQQHTSERAEWIKQSIQLNEAQGKIVSSIEKHDDKADERGRYVREEHKEMIEILGRINGYKEDRRT